MSVGLVLTGHDKDLGGGFQVRRLLPAAQRQSIGPFVFFDHFGPITIQPGANYDVRPHPHIGLATVTYLFDGAIMHRDSLGVVQRIEPGAINWMSAGSGIVHSERAPDDLRGQAYVNHGLQLWVALPLALEGSAPAFTHTAASAIPEWRHAGATVRVLVGDAFGQHSPVQPEFDTLYLDIRLSAGASLDLPALADEQAVYLISGEVRIDGQALEPHTLAMLEPALAVQLSSSQGAHLVVIGGSALDAPRTIWWNFVSSRKDRITQAALDWENQLMGTVPGESEFIPLPVRRFAGT